MAKLVNDRNELLNSAASRITGAAVVLSAGVASSLIVPRGAIVTTPSSLNLQANTVGYITPVFTWSYRFSDSGTFTAITGTANTITFACDAQFLTTAGANVLVQFKVDVAETSGNIGVNGSSYTLSLPIIREGVEGINGLNSVVVVLYKRTSVNAAPAFTAQDLAANSTYTFTSGQVVGQPTGWTQNIPAATSGQYLWVTQVLAASITSAYSFSNNEWSTAVLYSQDGVSGTNTAVFYAYQRSDTALTTTPGDVVYSFSTNSISTNVLANNWSKTIPTGTLPLYVTAATAASKDATDNILSTEWATPVLLAQNGINGTPGTNGTNGINGINTAIVYLYSRNNNSSTAPTLATTDSITYSFLTGSITGTIPSNWSTTLPSESLGSVVWIVQATAVDITTSATVLNTSWGTPVVLAQKGADGTPGSPGAAGTPGTPGTPGIRGSRQLYSTDVLYTRMYTFSPNPAGALSYAAKATDLIAAATSGTIPTTPITGDTVTFTNDGTYVYTITHDGTNWVTPGTVIDGSLLVTNSITASKINSNGLSIRSVNGDIILSATDKLAASNIGSGQVDVNATITIGGAGTSAPLVLSGTGEIISNGTGGDKARFYYGNVEIYKDVPGVGSVVYKALSRVETGVAVNNTDIIIPGYFRTQPKVIVSPASLQLYSVAYANQSQSIICSANNLTESSTGSMIWKFTPVAQLVLSANSSTAILNASSGLLTTNTWTSITNTSPANTTALQVSVNLTSFRGNGFSQYYFRQVVWKVQYSTDAIAWTDSSSRTVTIGQTAGAITNNLTVTLPSARSWYWRVVTTASDVGSSTWGSITYVDGTTYNSTNPNSYDVISFRSPTNFTMSAVSLAAGETITSVTWSYNVSWDTSWSFFTSSSVSGPGGFSKGGGFSSNPSSNVGSTAYSATETTTTFSTSQSLYAYVNVGTFDKSGYARLIASDFTAVIRTRKAAPNSTTPSNTFVINSVIYTLTGAQVLATGSLNWVALGE